jgi:hypothetical protein
MTMLIKTLSVAAASTVLATSAFAQTAKEIRGVSPYVAVKNEPAPKLIMDPPLPEGLAIGGLPGPVPGGEPAHRAGVRAGGPPDLSPGRASPPHRR